MKHRREVRSSKTSLRTRLWSQRMSPFFGRALTRGGLSGVWFRFATILASLALLSIPSQLALGIADCDEKVTAQIRLESQHPWRPPFGIERVGQPLTTIVEVSAEER